MDAQIFDLGLVDFEQAWQFQKEKFQEVKNGLYSRAFILCRHYPVITLGRSASTKNILASERELARRGIKVCSL
jgi:lipoate-protein ligase B